MTLGCGYDFKEDGLYAVMETNMGDMVFSLYYDKTPITVGNFVGLAEGTREFIDMKTGKTEKRPFYDGLIFHRVIQGFVIQGGCPVGTGIGGPGYTFVDEFVPGLKHDAPGVLSMANAGPGTNGSQFFVTLAPTPHLDGKHTVWGRLVHGMDVLREIGSVMTDPQDKPVKPVLIESVTIKRVGAEAQAFDAEKAFAANKEILKKQREESEKELSAFLKKLGIDESKIVETSSGLRYYIRKQGKGDSPKPGDMITAHYSGFFIDGNKFDSSYDRKEPIEIPIGVSRVIRGWDEAFLTMSKGEKRVLIIPPDLAYGPQGRPPVIPPGATLIFDVELIDYSGR